MNRNAIFVLQHNKLETRNQINGAEPKSFMSRKILNLIIMKKKNYFKKLALLLLVCSSQFIMAQVPSYVPTNGLVGYWPFNGNANDVSGGGRNGIVHSVNSTVNYPTGVNGSCINLTGSGQTGTNGDYVIIPPVGFNNMSSYTVSIWVKHDGNASPLNHDESYICGHSSSNSCSGTFSIECGTGFPNTSVGYSNHYVGGSDNSAFAGTWILRTLVINNGSISVYRNGILVSSQSGTTATDQESEIGLGTHWFCSGGTQSTRFIGAMDELGIWNRALTAEEINNLYYQNTTCQSLVINTGVLSFNPPTYNNTVTIYPNPANDHITIDCGTLANVVGYHIEIVNTLGQVVFNQPMNTQQYNVALNTWSGTGVYFVKIYDAFNNLLNTKKIILQ